MNKTLCITNLQDLAKLTGGELSEITVEMVDDEVSSKEDSGYMKLVPFVVFHTEDVRAGKLCLIQYLRLPPIATAEGEDPVYINSIGIGSPITDENDVDYSSNEVSVEGTTTFNMTVDNLIKTCINAAERQVFAETGVSITDSDKLTLNYAECAFFTGDQSIEGNKNTLGLIMPIRLVPEEAEDFKDSLTIDETKIKEAGVLGINFNEVITTFNLDKSIADLIMQLRGMGNFEDWSEKAVTYLVSKQVNEIIKHVNYDDLIMVYEKRVAEIKAIADAEPTDVVEETETVVEDTSDTIFTDIEDISDTDSTADASDASGPTDPVV